MPSHDIIVIGASAGGVEALCELVRELPTDLAAAIFVVVHVPTNGTSMMPQILSRAGSLPASHPKHGEPIQRGRIYVAPPNYHLLVGQGTVHLVQGPRENSHRPAIDPLFRTAARCYGRRVVGVVLSGMLDDGTAGLLAVKQQKGIAIAQKPEDALFPSMPQNAIDNVDVDYILPLTDIASMLVHLAHTSILGEEGDPGLDEIDFEADIAEADPEALQQPDRPGEPSRFACPDCGGVLFDLSNRAGPLRFRCRVGHAFSAESLLAQQNNSLEEALWVALRTLEEKALLVQRLADLARQRNQPISATHFEEQTSNISQQVALIREVLLSKELHAKDVTQKLQAKEQQI